MPEYRCCAGSERCLAGDFRIKDTAGAGTYGRYDGDGVYAGKWHDRCWDRYGYADFHVDPAYAGERLEEDY